MGQTTNTRQDLSFLVRPIVSWFEQNGRKDLPWRQNVSPYSAWVAEIMLQQTRIEAVIPYYHRFMQALPTIQSLAECDDESLMKLWQGLGYYSRARNLKKTAILAVERWGGLPADYDALLSLPGIGEYTAGAVSSIAFGLPRPAVDGNVLRVLSRLTGDDRDVLLPVVKNQATEALKAVYPSGQRASLLTEGLMELGEVVCLPSGEPLCPSCPLNRECVAYAQGRQQQLPVRVPKSSHKQEELTVLVLQCGELFALRRRPEKGLLAGLWELTNCPTHLSPEQVAERYPQATIEALGQAEHVFTHKRWSMTGYRVILPTTVEGDFVWVTKEALQNVYAVPTAFRAYTDVIKKV